MYLELDHCLSNPTMKVSRMDAELHNYTGCDATTILPTPPSSHSITRRKATKNEESAEKKKNDFVQQTPFDDCGHYYYGVYIERLWLLPCDDGTVPKVNGPV